MFLSSVNTGWKLKEKGNYQLAIMSFKQGLRISREIGNWSNQAKCLMSLGVLYWNTGNTDESHRVFKAALPLTRLMQSDEMYVRCKTYINIYRLYKKGIKKRKSGKYSESIRYFGNALDEARRIKSDEHELKCLRQLSISFWREDDLNKFYKFNKKAMQIAEKIYHKREVGNCLVNIGLYHLKKDEYSKALSCYQIALPIIKSFSKPKTESACLNNMGVIYKQLGDYDKSIDCLTEALELDTKLRNDVYICIDLINLGEALRNQGVVYKMKENFNKALDCFIRGLALARKTGDRKNEIKVLNNIGAGLIDLNNNDSALIYLKEALAIAIYTNDVAARGMILNNMGLAYVKSGNYKHAEMYFDESIEIGKNLGDRRMLWEAYFGKGRCAENQNKYNSAIKYFKFSISIIEHLRKQIYFDAYKAGFFRDKIKVYECLIELLLKKRMIHNSKEIEQDIFYFIERAKARSFLESLEESRSEAHEKILPKIKKIERRTTNRILDAFKKTNNSLKINKKYKNFFSEFCLAEEEFFGRISKLKENHYKYLSSNLSSSCTIGLIQDLLLDERTALIEYFLGENYSFMFVITENKYKMFLLPPRNQIINSIRAYLKVLSSPPKAEFIGTLAAKRLYDEFFYEAGALIPESIENLIIIPDGILYFLPFESLIITDHSDSYLNSFMVSKYKISYMPSSSAMIYIQQNKVQEPYEKYLLAFGNPSFYIDENKNYKYNNLSNRILFELYKKRGFNLFPLPYSEKEIRRISNKCPDKLKNVFYNTRATEETLKNLDLSNYQIIHFACHALIDEKIPYRSALVLSADNDSEEDGFLHVREIYALKLSAELVVLSACQTGQGRLENGEGILMRNIESRHLGTQK